MPIRVLVTDEIDRDGVALLQSESALTVDEVPTLPPDVLLERIADYDAIVGRSATRISEPLLRKGIRLRVVGRAGVGVDNIALDVATELGVAVINAPSGNTIAVAELFYGTVISLLRHLPQAAASMREGRWDRSKLLGTELKGRTLGIIGLGRIGTEIAARAHAFGVDLIAYDPYIPDDRFSVARVKRAPSLDALLAASDIITIHTPLTEETTGMIGRAELARLRKGAIVMNLARGGILDDTAVQEALVSGHLKGAVLDVYAVEPLAKDHMFRTAPNVVLTPHIGASTAEAQRNVAVNVCAAVRDALLRGELSRSINVAPVGGDWADLEPAMLVSRRASAVARAILAGQEARAIEHIRVRSGPALAQGGGALVAAAALGALEGVIESDRLNLINARTLAEGRGIELSVSESSTLGHPWAIEVCLRAGEKEFAVQGIAQPDAKVRLSRIGKFHVDVNPRDTLIILKNRDVPGVIGRVGTLLGETGVNIAEYHQARLAQGGDALAAISVDGEVGESIRKRLLELPEISFATVVRFVTT